MIRTSNRPPWAKRSALRFVSLRQMGKIFSSFSIKRGGEKVKEGIDLQEALS
jgi:hypothetical protein